MNLLSNENFLNILKKSNDIPFRIIKNNNYQCIEYDIQLNLLTFCKFKLPIKITIIGLPVSICEKGYEGSINELINDYKKKKGIFLILNDDEQLESNNKRSGNTLPTCIFKNKFSNFKDYLNSLRSQYRRRIKIALKKGENLKINKIKNEDFTQNFYKLYLNVLQKSKFPLETLNIDFFKLSDCDIFSFYKEKEPVAFVQLKLFENTLYFIFGGMDYEYRDEYDLYYNMLLFIVNYGIQNGCKQINFGQTAESSKMRIGCVLQNKYMHICSGNKLIDYILTKLIKYLEYKITTEKLKVFK